MYHKLSENHHHHNFFSVYKCLCA